MHSRVGHWLGAVMNMSVCTFMTKRTGLSTLRPSATKGRALFSGDLNPLICVMKYWYYTALVCWDKNITHKDSKKWDKLVKTASSARSQLGETGLCACCAGELYKDHVAGHPQQPQTPPPPRNTGQAEKHTKQTSPVPVLQNMSSKDYCSYRDDSHLSIDLCIYSNFSSHFPNIFACSHCLSCHKLRCWHNWKSSEDFFFSKHAFLIKSSSWDKTDRNINFRKLKESSYCVTAFAVKLMSYCMMPLRLSLRL